MWGVVKERETEVGGKVAAPNFLGGKNANIVGNRDATTTNVRGTVKEREIELTVRVKERETEVGERAIKGDRGWRWGRS